MDAKQAVAIAKAHLKDVFGDEITSALRLEEVWRDDREHVWCVTLGFFRIPDEVSKAMGLFSTYDYKIVRLDESSGLPVSIKSRDREVV